MITLPWKFWQCMMWFDWSKWIMWKMKKISYPKFIIHLLLIYYGFTRTKICSTCYSHMSVVANYFHICEGYYRLHGWLSLIYGNLKISANYSTKVCDILNIKSYNRFETLKWHIWEFHSFTLITRSFGQMSYTFTINW